MPIHQGPDSDFPFVASVATGLRGVYVGDLPVWVPSAGSAAVDVLLGPVNQLGLPSQVTVNVTIAGSPPPTWVRLEGQETVNYGELTLQNEFNAQTGTRRVIGLRLLQVEDHTPTGVPITYRVRASNGRTQDSASFVVTWPQR